MSFLGSRRIKKGTVGVGGGSALEIDYGLKCNFFLWLGPSGTNNEGMRSGERGWEPRVWKLEVEEERSGDDGE